MLSLGRGFDQTLKTRSFVPTCQRIHYYSSSASSQSTRSSSSRETFESRYHSIIASKPRSEIAINYLFYSLLSLKPLQAIVSSSVKHPFLRQYFTVPLLKASIYNRFCGGRVLEDCLPLIEKKLNPKGISFMIDESKEQSEDYDINTRELIEKLGKFHAMGCQFVPLKLTAYISETVLRTLSTVIPPLNSDFLAETTSDDELLKKIFDSDNDSRRLYEIGMQRLSSVLSEVQRLQQLECQGSRSGHTLAILLDAEQSDLQPAVELIYRQLALQFNRRQSESHKQQPPLVYNTYQCYLTRTPLAIERDYQHAVGNNLQFAVKLVRGAYLSTESKRTGSRVVVHPSKQNVDDCYDTVAVQLLEKIEQHARSAVLPPVSVVFATHNAGSVIKILQTIEQRWPDQEAMKKSIHFAQILGMSDYLTETIASVLKDNNNSGSVCKLILYGEFDYLTMWLIRRWEENQVSLNILIVLILFINHVDIVFTCLEW